MPHPIYCKKCGALIGVGNKNAYPLFIRIERSSRHNGKTHSRTTEIKRKIFFGLLRETKIFYPETRTRFSWHEYIGPPNVFLLWCAIVLGTKTKSVLYDGKWISWDWTSCLLDDETHLSLKIRKS